jgi:hypothetical protein
MLLSLLTGWLAQIYAMLAILPFASFVLIWFATYFMMKDRKYATNLSVDITVFLLIGSVYVMVRQVLTSSFLFWLVVAVMLIAAGLAGWLQQDRDGTVDPFRIFRFLRRVAFLMLTPLYFLLLLLGIIKYMGDL